MNSNYFLIEDFESNDNSSILNKNKPIKGSISDRTMFRFKTILLGNIAVGKTSILSRFVDSKYRADYVCSVGVEFKVKSLFINETTAADLQIWDTCGQEKFKTITRQYYRDTNGCILIFDLTNNKSFQDIEKWIDDLNNYGPPDSIKIIIGNKCDLVDERVVSFLAASEFAKKHEFDYVEVSAKTGENVKFLFEVLSRRMIRRQEIYDNKKLLQNNTPKKTNNNKSVDYSKSPFNKNDSNVKISKEINSEKKKSKCC